jgi:hypothetical protein
MASTVVISRLIRWQMAASPFVLFAAIFLLETNSAFADGCDIVDVETAGNKTKAATENFGKLVGCIKDLQERLARAEAKLSGRTLSIKDIALTDPVPAQKNESNDDWAVKVGCQKGFAAVSAYCFVEPGNIGSLKNIGVDEKGFARCRWTDIPEQVSLRAFGQALCVRVASE